MKSNPGPGEAAKNHHVHNACNALLRGKTLSENALEYLAGELRYKLRTIVSQATECKIVWEYHFPTVENVTPIRTKGLLGTPWKRTSDLTKFTEWFGKANYPMIPERARVCRTSKVANTSPWSLANLNRISKVSKMD